MPVYMQTCTEKENTHSWQVKDPEIVGGDAHMTAYACLHARLRMHASILVWYMQAAGAFICVCKLVCAPVCMHANMKVEEGEAVGSRRLLTLPCDELFECPGMLAHTPVRN